MGSNIHWTNVEIKILSELRQQGFYFSDISKKIGRSPDACRKMYKRLSDGYSIDYTKPKGSMCWICRKVGVGCKKPVKGWSAIEEVNSNGVFYIVKRCPEYEPDSWVGRYDCSEFYQNPPKVVKNDKTSRP